VWQSLLIYLLLLGIALPRLPAPAVTKSYRLEELGDMIKED
jgi:hypothetical protein